MVKVKKLSHYRGGPVGNCFKIYAAQDKPWTIASVFGEVTPKLPRVLVPTGLEIIIKGNFGVEISGRAGLASKHGIILLNPMVLTEENYGELKVVLCNLGGSEFTIFPGDIIGEAKIVKLANKEDVEEI